MFVRFNLVFPSHLCFHTGKRPMRLLSPDESHTLDRWLVDLPKCFVNAAFLLTINLPSESAGRSVQPWHISTTFRWIDMRLCTNIHSAQRMNHLLNLLTFPLATPAGQGISKEISQHLLAGLAWTCILITLVVLWLLPTEPRICY